MSRLFVIFMIVLLPLRGWAGDLMNVQTAASELASGVASAMPADCPLRAPADASAEGCASCALCIPLAELARTILGVAGFAVHAQPPAGGVDFVSAWPAPTLKPPIS